MCVMLVNSTVGIMMKPCDWDKIILSLTQSYSSFRRLFLMLLVIFLAVFILFLLFVWGVWWFPWGAGDIGGRMEGLGCQHLPLPVRCLQHGIDAFRQGHICNERWTRMLICKVHLVSLLFLSFNVLFIYCSKLAPSLGLQLSFLYLGNIMWLHKFCFFFTSQWKLSSPHSNTSIYSIWK